MFIVKAMNMKIGVLILSLIILVAVANTMLTSNSIAVHIELKGIKVITIEVLLSNGTVYATYTINSSTTIYVPENSYIGFNSTQPFIVDGPAGNVTAELLSGSGAKIPEYGILYNYAINASSTFIIIASNTTSSSTTTITTTTSTMPKTTTITLPVSNTTITLTAHSGTIIPTSTSSSSNNQLAIYAIIAVIVVVLAAFFVLRRVRK
uniref:Uncharacterized protein n=1 Tax=Sulfolobus neozealandicus TaxID=299422 RepID=Q5DVE3_9CREN|nr:hypothetical protein [Sulfolobus neozealandicus]